jgi:hypothetical protein
VFTDEYEPVTTFTMIAQEVNIEATYKDLSPDTYRIIVINGTSKKPYAEAGETITITANTPPVGKQFDKWTTTALITLVNEYEPITTFTMTPQDVTIEATYKNWDNYIQSTTTFPLITIYPNPVKNIATILRSDNLMATIEIYNLAGVLVQTSTIEGKSSNIDVSTIPKGVYTITCKDINNHIYTKKFVKD